MSMLRAYAHRMTPHDQQRFAKLISAISSNGSVAVSRHTDSDIEQICSHNVGPGMVSPITVAVVSEKDGRGRSARIEIKTVAAVESGRIEISALTARIAVKRSKGDDCIVGGYTRPRRA
jgi:hypothetical protein